MLRINGIQLNFRNFYIDCSTYQPQYGRVVITVVSELALDLECDLPDLELEGE